MSPPCRRARPPPASGWSRSSAPATPTPTGASGTSPHTTPPPTCRRTCASGMCTGGQIGRALRPSGSASRAAVRPSGVRSAGASSTTTTWPAIPRWPTSPSRPTCAASRGRGRTTDLAAWRAGETGFPIVDAGMRQLAATGWMHNRVRMIVASFLVKDLLVDWRRGEIGLHAGARRRRSGQQQRRLAVDRRHREPTPRRTSASSIRPGRASASTRMARTCGGSCRNWRRPDARIHEPWRLSPMRISAAPGAASDTTTRHRVWTTVSGARSRSSATGGLGRRPAERRPRSGGRARSPRIAGTSSSCSSRPSMRAMPPIGPDLAASVPRRSRSAPCPRSGSR